MNLLMFSTDQKIFENGSEVQERMISYAKDWEELHIIVYTKKSGQKKSKIGSNLLIYPTNSRFKPLYFLDAYKIASGIAGAGNLSITCQDPFETGIVGSLLKRKFKIPLEIQIHTDLLSPYFAKESLKNRLRVLLAKWLIPGADHLRVVSERIKKSVIAKIGYPESKIETRPIFVDTEKIKKAPIKTDLHKKYPSYDFIILMASRLTREKNIGLAIDAMYELATKPLLLIVGDGPEKKKLEMKVEKLGLKNNIFFEPYTENLVSYYKTADLYLLTSNYEGYGRTAVGAQAAGLPVLMTDVGVGIGETFPVGDLEQLVAKLSAKISQ